MKFLNITEHRNIGTVTTAQRRARMHLNHFLVSRSPIFPRGRPVCFGLVTWSRSSWAVVKVTVYPQCICPRYFEHARLYERILNEVIFIIIIPSLMAYPIYWIVNTELLDSAFMSWRITQIKEQDIKRLMWAHVAHCNFPLKLIKF